MSTTTTDTTRARRRVERARAKHEAARAELDAAIRDGRAEGLSLRDLASASGFAVEWVRRISTRAPLVEEV
jgi:hypothetical protein